MSDPRGDAGSLPAELAGDPDPAGTLARRLADRGWTVERTPEAHVPGLMRQTSLHASRGDQVATVLVTDWEHPPDPEDAEPPHLGFTMGRGARTVIVAGIDQGIAAAYERMLAGRTPAEVRQMLASQGWDVEVRASDPPRVLGQRDAESLHVDVFDLPAPHGRVVRVVCQSRASAAAALGDMGLTATSDPG